jgi:cellulose biosynthesis protein BcsQ
MRLKSFNLKENIMKKYAFWNNKGGTGKTSLAFQTICFYAEQHPDEKILAIDLCPQANFSELLLGGLLGNGSANLLELQQQNPRQTIGGYFQDRLPTPYATPVITINSYISSPSNYNQNVSENIDLVAGDALVELQSNAITTLANTQIPGTDTWLCVIDWVNNLIDATRDYYDCIFIDANPSFSIYTQIALAAANEMILPVMADDSSRRAIQNAFALIHGLNLPSAIYAQHNFANRLNSTGRSAPRFHIIAKNRLTQYMGSASAYQSVLTSIDGIVSDLLRTNPSIFSFTAVSEGMVEIRDFQTTGVVAFAYGLPFIRMNAPHRYRMPGRDGVVIRADYLQNCIDAINTLVIKL